MALDSQKSCSKQVPNVLGSELTKYSRHSYRNAVPTPFHCTAGVTSRWRRRSDPWPSSAPGQGRPPRSHRMSRTRSPITLAAPAPQTPACKFCFSRGIVLHAHLNGDDLTCKGFPSQEEQTNTFQQSESFSQERTQG